MKQRQFDILQKILKDTCSLNEIMDQFEVSKRTVYYDIEQINKEIKEFGIIKKVNKNLVYVGDYDIYRKMNVNVDYSYDIEQRQRYILDKIFTDEFTTIDEESNKLLVSKSTIFNDIKIIKDNLEKEKIVLTFDKRYDLYADEYAIRDYYIKYMYMDLNLVDIIDERILEINKRANLYLTDYSISLLSKLLLFTDKRIKKGKSLENNKLYDEAKEFYFFEDVKKILSFENENEIIYFSAFISTMTKLNNDNIEKNIKNFVFELIENFERLAAVSISNKDDFSKEISRHLQSSYYRLKFKFPIYNALLDDIKRDYMYLQKLVTKSVKSTKNKIFSEMKEEELGFLSMYFGARIKSFKTHKSRVVIVCPNGKVVSKMLESQLYNYLPTIEIVGVVSIHDLKNIDEKYDYIISTVELENYNKVILVKPILTSHNILELYQKLLNINTVIFEEDIDKIIHIVEKNAKIEDKQKLKENLVDYFIRKNEKKKKVDDYTRLSYILKENRINKISSVKSYEEAIRKASEILIKENSIKEKYIEDMLKNIEKFGPYVVITKKLAIPHAKNDNSVNRLDISILSVEKSFDLLGKEVELIIVIAPIDNSSHLKMLATLSEIIQDEKNIEILKRASYIEIIKLIKDYEK